MLNTVLQPVLLGAPALMTACVTAQAQPMADSPQAALTLIGRYAENQQLNEDMAEIVAWHQASHSILVINAKDASVDVLDAGTLTSAEPDSPLSASNLSRRGRIRVGRDVSIPAGGVNSVAVSGSLMAVAVENDDKQADGVIAFYTLDGDAREYFFDADEAACSAAGGMDWDEDDGCLAWSDEKRVRKLKLDATAFPDAKSLQKKKNLGRLKAVATEGDIDGDGDHDAIVAFGARSFSIWNADTGEQVFDSGDDFERITAEALGTAGFNATDDENGFDARSDDKGPEPEALAVGEAGGKRYAFIGLERTGGIIGLRHYPAGGGSVRAVRHQSRLYGGHRRQPDASR